MEDSFGFIAMKGIWFLVKRVLCFGMSLNQDP